MRYFFGAAVIGASSLACSEAERDVGTARLEGSSGAAATTEGSAGTGGGERAGASGAGASDPAPSSAGGTASAPEGTAGAGGAPGAGGDGGVGSGADAAAPGPAVLGPVAPDRALRILAVGDSITRATCWRAGLYERLALSFAGRFDFVGTLSENLGCAPAGYDRDNQGYSSSLVTEIAAGITDARTCDPICPTLDDLASAFATAMPDVILMHFGTNDVWNARPTESIIAAYTSVLGAARAANPNVVVLAAQIIPMNVTDATCMGCTCAGCPEDVPALNAAIATWASMSSTEASPVIVVDQFSGYDAVADNADGVHPNASGSQKIADRWYTALEPLF